MSYVRRPSNQVGISLLSATDQSKLRPANPADFYRRCCISGVVKSYRLYWLVSDWCANSEDGLKCQSFFIFALRVGLQYYWPGWLVQLVAGLEVLVVLELLRVPDLASAALVDSLVVGLQAAVP